ncbi:Hypothetical protein D9617_27g044910 [Elsinoe fawcettii]|nr:Hypothetical protein D9617_27g044910 [Elsinoe fawcettii]
MKGFGFVIVPLVLRFEVSNSGLKLRRGCTSGEDVTEVASQDGAR